MRFVFGLTILAALGAAQVPTEINFDDLQRSNPVPTFDHGYVAGWDMKQLHSVTLYTRDGSEAFSVTSLKLPDGTSTETPTSVAIDEDGTSAMVYRAQNGRRSGFALLDSAGKQLRVLETEPYKPSQVCFAPDHSIWIYGDEWQKAGEPEHDFLIFRHYSREGKLIGAYVPRSALPAWEGQGLDQLAAPFIGAAMIMGGPRQLWVELDFSGKLIGQWSIPSRLEGYVMPAAFDSKGVLYGDHTTGNNRHDGIWILDKTTGEWKPAPSLPAGHLIGADGVRLVYKRGDQLRWIPGLSTDLQETATATP
jgi:hypothetical protein